MGRAEWPEIRVLGGLNEKVRDAKDLGRLAHSTWERVPALCSLRLMQLPRGLTLHPSQSKAAAFPRGA